MDKFKESWGKYTEKKRNNQINSPFFHAFMYFLKPSKKTIINSPMQNYPKANSSPKQATDKIEFGEIKVHFPTYCVFQ